MNFRAVFFGLCLAAIMAGIVFWTVTAKTEIDQELQTVDTEKSEYFIGQAHIIKGSPGHTEWLVTSMVRDGYGTYVCKLVDMNVPVRRTRLEILSSHTHHIEWTKVKANDVIQLQFLNDPGSGAIDADKDTGWAFYLAPYKPGVNVEPGVK